jgi:hypothetical protein
MISSTAFAKTRLSPEIVSMSRMATDRDLQERPNDVAAMAIAGSCDF